MDQITKDLLNLPVPNVVLRGEVNQDLFHEVSECLLYLVAKGSPDIEIIITSKGGKSFFGRCIHDAIRLYPGKTTGVVLGYAYSAATFALQGCKKRNATKYSELLIHNPATGDGLRLEQLTNKKSLEKIVGDLQKSRDMMVEIYGKSTGKPHKDIIQMMNKNKCITPKEALEFGLIDEII